jgi:hypothetical protein
MLVEELVVEASNGGNFIVRADVHRCSPIWKNESHAIIFLFEHTNILPSKKLDAK